MKDLLLSLLTPANFAVATTAVLGLIATFVGASAVRRRRIAEAVFHAYHIAADVAAEAPGTTVNEIDAVLKAADKYMLANGWRALRPGDETDLATLNAKSLSGQAVVTAAVAAAAAVSAPASPAAPSPQ